ncbi:MAG: YbhN family protein [Acidimicrobiaceae bacterium]|nr:YbhN family protein [Acidimicrobiaceae bacterium]
MSPDPTSPAGSGDPTDPPPVLDGFMRIEPGPVGSVGPGVGLDAAASVAEPPTGDVAVVAAIGTAVAANRERASKFWHWARYIIGLALAAVAVFAVAGRTDELAGASRFLSHLSGWWVAPAVAVEVLSYVSFAALQRRLLAAGKVNVPVPDITGITVAGNAIQNTLPAGVVLAAAYNFRQYRHYGADDVLSGWAVVATAAVSMITLSVLAAAGLTLAASRGSALDLVTAIVGVLGIGGLIILAWANRMFVLSHMGGPLRLSQRLIHRPAGDVRTVLDEMAIRLSRVVPSRADWSSAGVYAMGNWVLDLGCLVLSFLAVGAGVPWEGILLAYAAAQLATNLPITPGGLGVVEGSLTVALVAFGGDAVRTVAAVLLYRLISFWFMIPVGWASFAAIAVKNRRHPELQPGPALAPLVAEDGLPLPSAEGAGS